jgi:hypothetical protein
MNVDRAAAFKDEVSACLREQGVDALMRCISRHFPDLEVYRENNDLIIRNARRFLVVRRVDADRFYTAQYTAAPSTNEVDSGGGTKRNADDLFNEISTFSEG